MTDVIENRAGIGHNQPDPFEMEKKNQKWERWAKKRTFVRALEGTYSHLYKTLVNEPRVYSAKDVPWKGGPQMFGKSIICPQATSIIQSIESHIEAYAPKTGGQKHGHLNSAVFYVLKGHGHDVHDGRVIPWKAGDVMLVENGCVHQHFNDSDKEECIHLVFKAKPTVSVHAPAAAEDGRVAAGSRSGARPLLAAQRHLIGGSPMSAIEDKDERSPAATCNWRAEEIIQSAGVSQGIRVPAERGRGRGDAVGTLARRPDQAPHPPQHGDARAVRRSLHAVPGRQRALRQAPPHVGGISLRGRGRRLRPALGHAVRLPGQVHLGMGPEPRKFPWKQGDYIYIPPYTNHQHFATKETRIIFMSNRSSRTWASTGSTSWRTRRDSSTSRSRWRNSHGGRVSSANMRRCIGWPGIVPAIHIHEVQRVTAKAQHVRSGAP